MNIQLISASNVFNDNFLIKVNVTKKYTDYYINRGEKTRYVTNYQSTPQRHHAPLVSVN